jgi:hypothetical protein
VRDAVRSDSTHLFLQIDSSAEATARDLTEREQACCSFFHFTFTPAGDVSSLWLNIAVPEPYISVLDSIEERARGAMSTRAKHSEPTSSSECCFACLRLKEGFTIAGEVLTLRLT